MIKSGNILIVNSFHDKDFPKYVIFNDEEYVFGTAHKDGYGIYYKSDWMYS